MKRLVLTTMFACVVFAFTAYATPTDSTSTMEQVFFTAELNAANTGPSDTSKGTATAWGVLNTIAKSLTYHITYAQLTSTFTAAHFHYGAAGTDGPVVMPITSFSGNTASGAWSGIPDSLISALLMGKVYINIHTQNYPAGEIRGQFIPAEGGVGFGAMLNAAQEGPTVYSSGTGTAFAILDSMGQQLKYSVTIAGLSSNFTAAHFHYAPTGISGPVVEPISSSFVDSTGIGEWTGFPDSTIANLINGDIYVNVHSTSYPAGELRGQLMPYGTIVFMTSLDTTLDIPQVSGPTSATGTAWAVLDPASASLQYRITYAQLSSLFLAAHFHYGGAGTAGPVVMPITTFSGNTASGIWSGLPDTIISALFRGDVYINVHSHDNTAGEIRGQLGMASGIGETISLDGSQDVPPLNVPGTGTGWVDLVPDSSLLYYHATVAGLTSPLTLAHFHYGMAGTNGGVLEPISFIDSTTDGEWTGIADSVATLLTDGGIYMNVHTSNNPAGEIRGQVELGPYSSSGVTAVREAGKSVPSSFKLAQNYPNPFNPSTVINFEVPVKTQVTLAVYNILGQRVATLIDGFRPAGQYSVRFNGGSLASGVYFYRLAAANFSSVHKMMLLK